MQELEASHGLKKKANDDTSQHGDQPEQGQGDAPQDSDPLQQGQSMAASSSCNLVAAEAQVDPCKEKALARVDAQLNRVTYHPNWERLAVAVEASAMLSQQKLFFLDAPTSKVRVAIQHLENFDKVLKAMPSASALNAKIVVTCGVRFEFLSTVMVKFETLFPEMQRFAVQLTAGSAQSLKKRAEYVAICTHVSKGTPVSMAYSVDALAARAHRGEQTRLRCMSALCPLRSQEERNALAAGEPASLRHELSQEHTEVMEDDIEEDADFDQDDHDVAVPPMDDIVMPPSDKRDYRVDLWPFGHAKDSWLTNSD